MREQLTSERVARDPRSKINRALAAWDCDVPELLQAKHTTKGIRPMKITRNMVGAEAKKNPAPIKWKLYDKESRTQSAIVGGVEVLVTPVRGVAEARSYDLPDWTRAILEVGPDADHVNVQLPYGSMRDAKDPYNVQGGIEFARKNKTRKNPARKPARTKNPRAGAQKRIVARYARVPMASINWSSMAMGDDRTPLTFVFSETEQAASSYRSYKLPDKVVKNRSFQALANALPENMMTASLEQIRDIARRFMR